MKILVIAPQPFYSVRGTPIAILRMLKVPLHDGAEVDVVTYPMGDDVPIVGLTVYRCLKIPLIKSIPIGPSFRKLVFDFFLLMKAFTLLCRKKYDLIHGIEEGAILATPFAKLFKTPLLYDMDSFIPDQMAQHKFFKFRPLVRLARFVDKKTIQRSKAIVTMCEDLTLRVHKAFPDKKVFQIEDVPLRQKELPLTEKEKENYLSLIKRNGEKVLLYIGNLEKYQGIDLLLQSLAVLVKSRSDFGLLLVGGEEDQINNFKKKAAALGIDQKIVFAGKQPLEKVNSFYALGNILLSPRTQGTNTPFKIYSYMDSGVPIVATDLWTHQQALNKECAILTEPTPEAYAAGIEKILEDAALGRQLGKKAQEEVNRRFSNDLFDQKTREMYRYITQ